MKKTGILVLAVLMGCSSEKKPDQPQPRIEETPSKTPAAEEKVAAPSKEEPIAITIKKGDKKPAEAAFKGAPPPGHVSFDFTNVDLATVALPLFSTQAGVIVEYHSKNARKVTLRLNQPVPWRDALGLICQWTQTHVIRSQIAGRLELKEGFADPAALLAKFDPNDKSGSQAGQGKLGDTNVPSSGATGGGASGGGTTSSSGGGTTSSSGSSGAPGYDTSDYQQPTQPGADRIDELRRGVTTTNSGAK